MWYQFKPYVPVAQRRAQAAREVARREKAGKKSSPVVIEGRAIATTFWGKAWCENLESYSDFENRLPRGRTYVRNGSVVDLQVEAGKIDALVSGSELYKVAIAITALPQAEWASIKSRCGGQVTSAVELLQGRLPKGVIEIVTAHEGGLFPKPKEIRMSCTCPDWAGMCKHVAAVMYGVGSRLDHQPEMLFKLRVVDHLELVEAVVETAGKKTATKKKTLADADVAGVFGIELAPAEEPAKPKRGKAKPAEESPKPTKGRKKKG